MEMLRNQQGGWNMVQSITGALESRLRLEEQRRQFNENLQVRATEFNRNMALDEARFDEQKRQNLFNAQLASSQNELRWKEFQNNQQLFPIELQRANIQLETARINNARALEADSINKFNVISNPFDQKVAAYLAQTQDARLGQEYLSIKQEGLANTARNGSFNPIEYSRKVDDLLFRYGVEGDNTLPGYGSEKSQTSEYSPQVTQMLHNIGAHPSIIQDYERKNPDKMLTESSLRASGLFSPDERVFSETGTIAQLQRKLSPDELTSYIENREGYLGLTNKLNALDKDRQAAQTRLGSALGKPEEEKVRSLLDNIQSDIDKTTKERERVYRLATGQSQPVDPQNPIIDDPDAEIKDRIRQSLDTPPDIEPDSSVVSFGASLRNKQSQSLASVRELFKEEGNSIDFKHLAGKNVAKRTEDQKYILRSIYENVLPLGNKEIDRKFNELFSDERKRNQVNSARINFFNRRISGGDVGIGSSLSRTQTIDAAFDPINSFQNPTVEEAIEFLSQRIPDSNPRKLHYKKVLYSLLVSNTYINALSD